MYLSLCSVHLERLFCMFRVETRMNTIPAGVHRHGFRQQKELSRYKALDGMRVIEGSSFE